MHNKPEDEMMVARNGADAKMLGQMDAEEEVEEISTQLIFEDLEHPNRTMLSLHMMQRNRHFCDVVLNVGNSEIHAHRAVLASVSPYLFELFSTDDETKGNVRENTVVYKLNCSFQRAALDVLVDYAYTAKLCLENRLVKPVYLAALHLKMERVVKECARHLIKHLAVDNCIDTRVLSGISRHESFVSQVNAFIADKFEAVRLTPSFLSLACVRVEVLSQTRQEISMVEMNSVCQLVLDWIHRQIKEESNDISELADKAHMLYLALDNSLQDCSELPNGEMSDSEVVQDYKKLHKKTTSGKSRRKGQMQPAKPRVLLLTRDIGEKAEVEKGGEWTLIAASKIAEHTFQALVTIDSRLATLSVAMRLTQPPSTPSPVATTPVSSSRAESQEKEIQPDTFCAMAHMSSVKCAIGCANLNEQLLVCGGYDRVECLKSVETYDPEWNLWAALAPMREARGRFNIAVVRGEVYAVGGSNGTTELATVEKYNQEKQEWTRVASLPLARSHTGVCNLNDRIYCIGGWNGQVGIKQCDVLDPDVGQWTQIAPLHMGRQQAGVCAMNGCVFAVGGCDAWNCLNSVEVYDPNTNEWNFLSEMITARRGCGVAAFRGKLYVVGGSDGSHSLSSTEIYDPELKTWTPGPNLTTPRANVGVAVIGSRLYAVGGFSGKNFLNTIEYLDENTDEWTTFVPKTSSTSSSPQSSPPCFGRIKQFEFTGDLPSKQNGVKQASEENEACESAAGGENGLSSPEDNANTNGVAESKKEVSVKDNEVQDIMKENGVLESAGIN